MRIPGVNRTVDSADPDSTVIRNNLSVRFLQTDRCYFFADPSLAKTQ